MELPSRPKNDRYTPPGRYQELERRLRANPETAEISALVCYAFDMRTRLGPFLFADMRLLTAGPRAIAAALHEAGFTKTVHRLRRSGLLDDIPGLVFREGDEKAPLSRLIHTGIQRLVQNLDELPHPIAGMGLIEPPHQRRRLTRKALPVDKLHRYAGM